MFVRTGESVRKKKVSDCVDLSADLEESERDVRVCACVTYVRVFLDTHI